MISLFSIIYLLFKGEFLIKLILFISNYHYEGIILLLFLLALNPLQYDYIQSSFNSKQYYQNDTANQVETTCYNCSRTLKIKQGQLLLISKKNLILIIKSIPLLHTV